MHRGNIAEIHEIEKHKKRIAGQPCNTRGGSLPLLPPGPDGVRDSLLRRTRLSQLNPFDENLWRQCAVSAILFMAERVRFELTVLAYTRVPGVHLKPLGHLSGSLL